MGRWAQEERACAHSQQMRVYVKKEMDLGGRMLEKPELVGAREDTCEICFSKPQGEKDKLGKRGQSPLHDINCCLISCKIPVL